MLALTCIKNALDLDAKAFGGRVGVLCRISYQVASRASDRIPLMGDRAHVCWGSAEGKRDFRPAMSHVPRRRPGARQTNAFMSLVEVVDRLPLGPSTVLVGSRSGIVCVKTRSALPWRRAALGQNELVARISWAGGLGRVA